MNRKPAIIAGLVGLVLILGMLVVLISPKASQVRKKQTEVESAQQQQGTLETQLEQLQAAAKDAPKERKRLAVLQRQIPPSADLPGIIRLLNNTSDKAGVDFMTITPGQPSPAGPISVIRRFIADETAQEALILAYEQGLIGEVQRIAAAVPHDQLAVQWDVASAVFERLERREPTRFGRTRD